MIRKTLAAILAGVVLFLAVDYHNVSAQSPTQCPTRPPGDNTNACASTAFVTAAVSAATIIYSNITGVPAHRFLGNNTGATANAIAMTAAEATAELNAFTSSLKGLVPSSGGGTVNYLRADGTFAAPTGALPAGPGVVGTQDGVTTSTLLPIITPQMFGAVGDCATNDQAAFQSAVDKYTNGAILYIPPVASCYLIGSAITITKRIVIIGNSYLTESPTPTGGSVIKTSSGTANVFVVNNLLTPVVFSNFAIGATVTRTAGAGIIFTATTNINSWSVIDRMFIANQRTGIDAKYNAWLTVVGTTINYMADDATGIAIGDRLNQDAGENGIHRSFIVGTTGTGGTHPSVGVLWVSGGGFRVQGNKFLGGKIGLQISSEAGTTVTTGQFNVTGNSYDGQTEAGIKGTNANAGDGIGDIVISSNTFYGNGSPKAINIAGSTAAIYNNIIVASNIFHSAADVTGYATFSATNVNIAANILRNEGGGGTGLVCTGSTNATQSSNGFAGWGTNQTGC